MTLEEVEKKLESCYKRLKKLQAEKECILSNTLISCPDCTKVFAVKDATFIQTHFYVSPYGCSGGDYWSEGEGQINCPRCESRLRIYKHPELIALKKLFREVIDEHKH